MAVSANSRLFILLLVAVANRSATEEFKSAENVETFLNSIIQLRDKSDTFKQYATQVQSLFCPEQPICGDVDEKNRTDDLRNLSISMGFGLDDSRVEDVFNAIRACCLPCSCDVKTCTENGNCCPSQIFSDVVSNNLDDDVPNVHGDVSDTNETFSRLRCDETKPLHSECIKAVRDSYMDKNVIHLEHDLTIPSYFMIAQCFGNCASDLTVKKCHHPSGNEFEEMVPVTSSDTRRIYWNTHCARCNNDGSNLVPWNSTVRFNFDIAYFFNHSSDTNAHYPENHDDILDYISKSGYILFTPPFPIADKLCIQKNILKTCMRPSTTTTNAKETSWLHEACDHIYSPFIVRNIFGRAYPFLNVFCYLCQHQNVKLDVKQSKQRQCEFTLGHLKSSSRQVTGLLNYRALTGDTVTDINEGRVDSFGSTDGKCGCAKTLDTTAHICRRLYCPAGDFMIGCRCVQLIKPISGMPILLTIKLIPGDGHLTAVDDKHIPKVLASLRRRMCIISENITVDFISMYEIKTDLQEYFLSLAVVRSFPGHDTKDTLKPFLEYLDKNRFEIAHKQMSYYGELTSRVRLWEEINDDHYSDNKILDLEAVIRSQKILFQKSDIARIFRQKFQAISPLLYCLQIQLNATEFEKSDDGLIVITSSRNIKIPYYRQVTPSLIRVCADSFININKNTGYQMSLSLYACVMALARCVAIILFQ